MTVLRVKEKLQSHVGSSVGSMRLQMRDERGAPLAALDDDAKPLGFYSPRDGFSLHVVDTDAGSASAAGWLEDVSKVQKFELSDEAYDARDNTYRKFRAEQLKADPAWTMQRELAKRRGVRAAALRAAAVWLAFWQSDAAAAQEEVADAAAPPGEEHQAELAAAIAVGARCEVQPGGKRGVVMCVSRQQRLSLSRLPHVPLLTAPALSPQVCGQGGASARGLLGRCPLRRAGGQERRRCGRRALLRGTRRLRRHDPPRLRRNGRLSGD
jgi:tubulin-folding cofactor B